MSLKPFTALGVTLCVGLSSALIAPVASAAVTTFASFTAPVTESFNFTNTGTGTSGFNLSNPPADVTFTYVAGQANGYGDPNTPISALMNFSATVNGFGTQGGGVTVQQLKDINISFTAVSPRNGLTNLLSFTGATGRVLGATNGGTFNLTIDTSLGDTLTYSSDFLLFPNSVGRELNIGFTSTSPSFKLAGASGASYLNSLSSNGNGNFAADPQPLSVTVPEPNVLSLLGVGTAVLGVATVRRRKKSDV